MPFAVAGVEHQNALPVFEPEHRFEVMRLAAIEPEHAACGKRRIDIEPGRTEIVMRHAGPPFPDPLVICCAVRRQRASHAKANRFQLESRFRLSLMLPACDDLASPAGLYD
jgi:hypothetical protein